MGATPTRVPLGGGRRSPLTLHARPARRQGDPSDAYARAPEGQGATRDAHGGSRCTMRGSAPDERPRPRLAVRRPGVSRRGHHRGPRPPLPGALPAHRGRRRRSRHPSRRWRSPRSSASWRGATARRSPGWCASNARRSTAPRCPRASPGTCTGSPPSSCAPATSRGATASPPRSACRWDAPRRADRGRLSPPCGGRPSAPARSSSAARARGAEEQQGPPFRCTNCAESCCRASPRTRAPAHGASPPWSPRATHRGEPASGDPMRAELHRGGAAPALLVVRALRRHGDRRRRRLRRRDPRGGGGAAVRRHRDRLDGGHAHGAPAARRAPSPSRATGSSRAARPARSRASA